MFTIECEHFDLTPSIKEAVSDQMESITKFVNKAGDISVFLKPLGHKNYSASIKLRTRNHDYFASHEDRDLYKAIHDASKALVRQLGRAKEKVISQRHKKEVQCADEYQLSQKTNTKT
jgi:ribosomal subunit interface protein